MPSPAAPSAWEPYRARCAAYADIRVNYDYASQAEYTSAAGWRVDD